MKPQMAGFRTAGMLCRVTRRVRLAQVVAALFAAVSDGVLAVGIVLASLMAWAPRIGIEAAKQTIAARRAKRRHIAEIAQLYGAVWARHARRSPEAWARYGALRD